MSSPINDDGSNDRLKYAPPWARQSAPKDAAEPRAAEPASDPFAEIERALSPRDLDLPREDLSHPRDLDDLPEVEAAVGQSDLAAPESQPLEVADAPATAPRAPDSATWLRTPAKKPFEGDLAMRELRSRLTLEPQLVPEPPLPPSPSLGLKHIGRLLGVTAFAAGAAYAVVLFAFPDGKPAAPSAIESAPSPMAASVKTDRTAAPARSAPVRLTLVESRRVLPNEPAPLGVTLTAPVAQGAVILRNVASGARVAMGTALGGGSWRIAVSDLSQAAVGPPADFVGAMDISVELLLADDAVADRSAMRIEWAPAGSASQAQPQAQAPGQPQALAAPEKDSRPAAAQPPAGGPALDREELAILLKRGQDFLTDGDLASARLMLRRAADGGDAQAALLLGSTYDPAMFKQLKVIGSAPDPVQARMWYQRAVELGSTEAVRRLEPLAQGTR